MPLFHKTLFLLTAIFFLSGCGVSGIDHSQNKLTLQVEQNQVLLDADLLQKKADNFAILFLSQKILRLKEGNIVVLEEARTDDLYEFSPPIRTIISVLFETRSIIRVYARNNLYAYQLALPNKQILNVIAQKDETQSLKFIYGMSNRQFNTMLKQLDPNAPIAPYKDVIRLNSTNNAVLSKWDTRKIQFYPLVRPLSLHFGL